MQWRLINWPDITAVMCVCGTRFRSVYVRKTRTREFCARFAFWCACESLIWPEMRDVLMMCGARLVILECSFSTCVDFANAAASQIHKHTDRETALRQIITFWKSPFFSQKPRLKYDTSDLVCFFWTHWLLYPSSTQNTQVMATKHRRQNWRDNRRIRRRTWETLVRSRSGSNCLDERPSLGF